MLFEEFVECQKDTVRRCAVIEFVEAWLKLYKVERAGECQGVSTGGLFAAWGDDRDFTEGTHCFNECFKSFRFETIVIGDKYLFHCRIIPYCFVGLHYNLFAIIPPTNLNKGYIVQKEPMLRETYVKLSEELENLKTNERGKIAKVIDEARELGDLKENAEYHAAKERQGLMEARISELTDIIGRAQVVDPATLAHERVSFGSTVCLTCQESGEELKYTIVGSMEAQPEKGLISFQSPMARALIGKEEGDEVELSLPSGKKAYDIEEVLYEEIKLN